jgi:hypothetical protein
LVEVDPKKSKEAVSLLSNLLRFSLSTNYDRLVSIENELQMVDSYLSLEKIRFEERLNVKKKIDYELTTVKIPAFTIQTLVENAIKHGVSKLVLGGEILIRIEKEDNLVLIQVANSGEIGKQKDLGIGLSNLRKRLDIEYKRNCSLSLYQAGVKNTIVTFGLEISISILNFLLKIDPNKIYISFNNDSQKNNAGNQACEKGMNKLLRYFDSRQLSIQLPTKKDFGEMNKEEILQWKNNL